tara:strand:- start:234 stop:371 length:138 start_codon:yes stop_codon:yes gene_type:complete
MLWCQHTITPHVGDVNRLTVFTGTARFLLELIRAILYVISVLVPK